MMIWIIITVAGILTFGLLVAGTWFIITDQAGQKRGQNPFNTADITLGRSELLDPTLARPTYATTHPGSIVGGCWLLAIGLITTVFSLIVLIGVTTNFISGQQKIPLFDYFIMAGSAELIMLLGLGLLAWGLLTFTGTLALNIRGKITQGVVFDRWSYIDDYDSSYSSYKVAFYFDPPWRSTGDSRIIGAEDNRKAYNKLTVGDTVRIRYLPGRPEICRLEV